MSFKHRTPIQIRFKDVDKMGHVNNANHATYFELARMKYFSDVVGTKIDWTRQGVILARIEIDYKLPILLDDQVTVLSKCTRLGSKSFDISHIIVKSVNGTETELASGKSVVVCYDYEKNATIPVPEEWKRKALSYEE
ncbi:MAG: thioesterase family protein [Bacteroidota bacterium]